MQCEIANKEKIANKIQWTSVTNATYPSGRAKTILLAWERHRLGEILPYELLADGWFSWFLCVGGAVREGTHRILTNIPIWGTKDPAGRPPQEARAWPTFRFSVRPLNFSSLLSSVVLVGLSAALCNYKTDL